VCGDVIQLIVALTGHDWMPQNHISGSVLRPKHADYRRKENERLDRVILHGDQPWYEAEKDDSRGRALPEHMEAAIKNGGAA
jgi:hypothetical protein